jgi:hypothetical protein
MTTQETLTVQALREKVMRHCDEFLSLPIADRSATGLKAVVDAIVAIGEVVEQHERRNTRSAITKYPFAVDAEDPASEAAESLPVGRRGVERKSAKGSPIPGVDL